MRRRPSARTRRTACVRRFGSSSPGTRDENIRLIDYRTDRKTAMVHQERFARTRMISFRSTAAAIAIAIGASTALAHAQTKPQPATPTPAAARPASTARAGALNVPFTQFTLPNGLHVILHEDHTVPLATVNVWYHVGSAREKPGRTGFAHLFEHLMFEGSGHVKEGEFDNLLEAAGGDNNASTWNDRTNYYIN